MKLSTTYNPFILAANEGMTPYRNELLSYLSCGFSTLDCIFCDAGKDSPLNRPDWLDWGKSLRGEADRLGIEFAQAHLPTCNFADRGRTEETDERMRRSVILSAVLGAKWTVAHPATDFSLERPEDSFVKNREFFAPYVALAERNGVGIAFENMANFDEPPCKPWYCARVEELISLADSFGSEYAGICWDFGHANLVYPDQNPALRAVGKRLKCVHVHDNRGDGDFHLPVFFGSIEWEPLMHTLYEIGYEGTLDFEVKRIRWTLPREMREAQWRYVRQTGLVLLESFV